MYKEDIKVGVWKKMKKVEYGYVYEHYDFSNNIALEPEIVIVINYPNYAIEKEIEGVVGVAGVEWVAVLRFVPGDDLADVFNDGFAFGQVLQGKHPFAVNAGATHLDATVRFGSGGFGHGKKIWYVECRQARARTYMCVRARTRTCACL